MIGGTSIIIMKQDIELKKRKSSDSSDVEMEGGKSTARSDKGLIDPVDQDLHDKVTLGLSRNFIIGIIFGLLVTITLGGIFGWLAAKDVGPREVITYKWRGQGSASSSGSGTGPSGSSGTTSSSSTESTDPVSKTVTATALGTGTPNLGDSSSNFDGMTYLTAI